MEDFRILDPDPYNNSTGSASLFKTRYYLFLAIVTCKGIYTVSLSVSDPEPDLKSTSTTVKFTYVNYYLTVNSA